MKKLSDYQGEEAIQVWGNLIEPGTAILRDKKLKPMIKGNKSQIEIATYIIKNHAKEVEKILLAIDSTPVNGINLLGRTMTLLSDITDNAEALSFFGVQTPKKSKASTGSVTENTTAKEK